MHFFGIVRPNSLSNPAILDQYELALQCHPSTHYSYMQPAIQWMMSWIIANPLTNDAALVPQRVNTLNTAICDAFSQMSQWFGPIINRIICAYRNRHKNYIELEPFEFVIHINWTNNFCWWNRQWYCCYCCCWQPLSTAILLHAWSEENEKWSTHKHDQTAGIESKW